MLIVTTAYKYFHFILRILFRVILSLTVNLNKYQASDSSSYSWIIDRGLWLSRYENTFIYRSRNGVVGSI